VPVSAAPFDTAQDALEAAIAITNDAAASPVLAGQASATNGSPTITWSSGAPFSLAMQGLGILIAGTTYQIGVVVSPTSLNLTANFTGTSGSVSWTITPALLTGSVLNPSSNPAVWPLVNHCYRELEDELLRLGVETFTKTADLLNLEPSAAPLPRTTLYINWTGYWDGNETNDEVLLPDDLLTPLEVWECPSGSNMTWLPMRQAPDQLKTQLPGNRFQQWGWWDNQLNIPQCTQQMDLRIRYLAYASDITDGTTPLVIPHSKTALAYLVAATAAKSRGGLEIAAVYKQDAKEAIGRIASRTARREDYSRFVRKPFRGGYRGAGRGRGMWTGPLVQP
jgi:hypothetical protein